MAGNVSERIRILQGDITLQQVDAIVNAANSSLLGGGGVDGAIHRAAGPQLLEYCRTLGGCPTGEARLSPGFQLPAKWVIHTVGPVWQGGGADEDRLLARCYRNSLLLAARQLVRTIAFPQISTGVYGFPMRRAASIAVAEMRAFLSRPSSIEEVRCVVFSDESRSAVGEALAAAADE
jgi:O-acetyl-ADP-ribose deacetylase